MPDSTDPPPPLTIAAFYDAEPRRRTSVEREYGDGWTDATDSHATYRARWVVDTGELYVVREPQHGGVLARWLETLHLEDVDVAELRVEVLAVEADDKALEQALLGWEDAMAEPDSLSWLRGRLRRG